MRIAIIGAGISGLVAAHELHEEHDITVFEASDRVGGHTHTIDVHDGSSPQSVDTGFIVYNETTYPHFTALLKKLDVETQETDMSFSVTSRRNGLEYNGSTIRQMFVQKSNLFRPSFYRMIREILRFNKLTHNVLTRSDDDRKIRQFVRDEGFSREFTEQYLIPLGASLWSCPASAFLDFPLFLVVRFLANHGMNTVDERPQWRVIKGGSRNYVTALTRGFRDSIRTNSPVVDVRRFSDAVQVCVAGAEAESFDHVIFACHSDQAIAMLSDPSPLESEIIGSFGYQKNTVFLHTDTSILPKRRKAWASWNYHIPKVERQEVSVTYDMNILQRLESPKTWCVTLNEDFPLDPVQIHREIQYEHPLYTVTGMQMQNRHDEVINKNRTSFCGAYWGNGFHEDGVRSALAVTQSLKAVLVS